MFTRSLNHIIQPSLSIEAFFSLAKSAECQAVEIRNDLTNTAIQDGTSAETVKKLSEKFELEILSINALQQFNIWNSTRAQQAGELFDYAKACGARAVVLVPDNNGSLGSTQHRQQILQDALTALKPLLEQRELIGLIEPLGFETASLRSKREAIDAIIEIDGSKSFALVHDTFHHFLGGETDLYPEFTGLVHASGVAEPHQDKLALRDEDRILVNDKDILNNVGQLATLLGAAPQLPVSLEPFSPMIQNQLAPLTEITSCFSYLDECL